MRWSSSGCDQVFRQLTLPQAPCWCEERLAAELWKRSNPSCLRLQHFPTTPPQHCSHCPTPLPARSELSRPPPQWLPREAFQYRICLT